MHGWTLDVGHMFWKVHPDVLFPGYNKYDQLVNVLLTIDKAHSTTEDHGLWTRLRLTLLC